MKNRIEHLFFDLDHTLWDFETNSRITLLELFTETGLEHKGLDFELFYSAYKAINEELWSEYRQKKIDKSTLRARRFAEALLSVRVNSSEIAEHFETEYVARSPHKTALMPNVMETLHSLKPYFHIHIITNGFSEVQDVKIEKSGLKPYITHRITSDIVGVHKPDPEIFRQALFLTGAKQRNSVMIGDHLEADVLGAMHAGLEAVYFNPDLKPHNQKIKYEIAKMGQLLDILL